MKTLWKCQISIKMAQSADRGQKHMNMEESGYFSKIGLWNAHPHFLWKRNGKWKRLKIFFEMNCVSKRKSLHSDV